MRKILFKGKRLDNGEWVEGFYCNLGGKYHYILTGMLDIMKVYPDLIKYAVDPDTVGQFTGLTDCGKAKLFEHDVVTAKFKSNGARYNFIIIFKDGAFLFDNGKVAVRFDQLRSVRKIGNIHDNPELLKEGESDA